jgi:hypothetical protein
MQSAPKKSMPCAQMTPDQQGQMHEYVQAAQDRFSTFRDNKETMALPAWPSFWVQWQLL